MVIFLNDLNPKFIEPDQIKGSEIWKKKINFDSGKFYQIVAPSGSGKSTLINFIYGTRKDHAGTIMYDSKDLSAQNIQQFSELRQKNISIIFQDLKLFPDLTCYENINLKRLLEPLYPANRIYEMAEKLGITSTLNKKSKICSLGEQQRVAIIRSLMQPFQVLLLDEPFSHLDKSNQERAMELIVTECKNRNATMLLADLEKHSFFNDHSVFYL